MIPIPFLGAFIGSFTGGLLGGSMGILIDKVTSNRVNIESLAMFCLLTLEMHELPVKQEDLAKIDLRPFFDKELYEDYMEEEEIEIYKV
jgi:hypothetical protein